MSILAKLTDKLENRVADAILVIGTLVLAGGLYLADYMVPPHVLDAIGPHTIAQALLGSVIVIVLLGIWVVHLRLRMLAQERKAIPKHEFLSDLGVWRDAATGRYHCVKCDKRPLQTVKEGLYCAACDWVYKSPEQLEREEAERRREDELVRQYNAGLIS